VWVLAGGPGEEVLARTLIVQPRSLVQAVKPWEWTREHLRGLMSDVTRMLADLNLRRLRYKAGAHCRYCAAAAICPQLAAVAEDAAMAGVLSDPELRISGEELDRRLAMVPALELHIARLKALGLAYMEAGGQLTAAKLVAKRSKREWKDEGLAEAWMREAGLDPYLHALRSPKQAEDAVGTGLKPHVARLAEKKKSTERVLAWADDSRPAVPALGARAAALSAQDQAIIVKRRTTTRRKATGEKP
jgi:hypothetical protein